MTSKRESSDPAPGPAAGPGSRDWAARRAIFKGVQLFRETALRLLILAKADGFRSIAGFFDAVFGKIIADKWQAHLRSNNQLALDRGPRSPTKRGRAWAVRGVTFKGVQLYRETAFRLLILAKADGFRSIAEFFEAALGGIVADKWQAHLRDQGRPPRKGGRNRAG